MISIIILAIVFFLIAVRKFGKYNLKIWQIMLGGAIAVILLGQISLMDSLKSINLDVMIFLTGMFIVGSALEESGYLSHISYNFFKKAKSLDALLIIILLGAGFFSAFLMNDTIAIIGTPVMILLAKKHKIHSKILLLTLAFAVTIGSVMSPIGNPQNLLIALQANISNPFVTFLKYLFVPTIINLFVAYLIIKLFYKEHFNNEIKHSQEPIKDHNLAMLSKISLIIIGLMIVFKIILVFLGLEFSLTYIAIAGALPLILFSKKRWEISKKIDWHTLVFFAAMFILMQAVWNSNFFQPMIENFNVASIPSIFSIGIILSQLISNVPLVALYIPVLQHAGAGTIEFLALAAASTIAGNLLILGAASNIIIIQNAEKKNETITFWEFAKIGIPLTIINVLIYYFFFLFYV